MLKKVQIAYECLMLILVIASVSKIWSDNKLLWRFDFFIWMLFVVDYFFRVSISEQKWHYIKKHPLDLIAIIPLDAIFRLARLARLVRVLRLFAIGMRYYKPVHDILKRNGLQKAFTIVIALIFAGAIPIVLVEDSITTYHDAVWWSIVTATTVGYGDISPETILGRLIAVIFMVFGIGLIGLLTGTIATYFIDNKQNIETADKQIEFVKSELDRIDELSNREIENLVYILNSRKITDTHTIKAKKIRKSAYRN
ncbi:potassium channel family protein [Salipaludibacillus sp. CUR1]|uniref:potassium channel family protein n=1 Tax=Salipaludibacillus sp. CUR1 TaxID=2820003 RepID=UPI001E546A9D|nr:potassium channel family protein [Salipaludibacillus sp. CUR1]MCE7792323.1 potassium channel family protein [Salipaludibacillus sp. CUR1]